MIDRFFRWLTADLPKDCCGYRTHHFHRKYELVPTSFCHKGRYVDVCCRCGAKVEIPER